MLCYLLTYTSHNNQNDNKIFSGLVLLDILWQFYYLLIALLILRFPTNIENEFYSGK